MKGMQEKRKEPSVNKNEIKIIILLSNGYNAKDIASELNLSQRTIETYILNARLRGNYANATQMVCDYIRKGIIK